MGGEVLDDDGTKRCLRMLRLPVDDHVRMELLENGQLILGTPLLRAVHKGVGLEENVAEVG